METVKDVLKVSDLVLKEKVQSSAETSLIVPDKFPDILKIIEVDSSCGICKKTVKDGRISVEGEISADIIYLPEGSDEVKALNTTFDFNEVFDFDSIKEDTKIFAFSDIESIDVNLINSRKISARAIPSINLYAFCDSDVEYIKEIDTSKAASRQSSFDSFCVLSCQDKEVSIKEKCDGTGVCELLKTDTFIKETETKIVGDKVVVKGAVFALTLYKTQDNSIKSMTSRFPFTEVFEVEGLTDTDSIHLRCDVIRTNTSILDTSPKYIYYDILLNVSVVVAREMRTQYVSDAFIFGSETETETETKTVTSYRKCDKQTKSIHEIIPASNIGENITSVYNVIMKPVISGISDEGDSTIVSVSVVANILYLENNSIGCHNAEINTNFKIPNAESSEFMYSMGTENISYNLSESGIELRGNVCLDAVGIEKKEYTYIKGIEKKECERENELIIFFSNGNDTVWDISKKYRVNPEEVMDLNCIESDTKIKKGQRIIIPSM